MPGCYDTDIHPRTDDPEAFAGLDVFTRQTGWLADACYANVPLPGKARVRLPGEQALVCQREAREQGLPLAYSVVQALQPLVEAAGLMWPIFRKSLENENRLCLCSFMGAEYDDLPGPVKVEVQAFADVNVVWLEKTLIAANTDPVAAGKRARASFSTIAGAQLMARSRADLALFDGLVETYRSTGLLPA